MIIYEVFKDGRANPLDVVGNYKTDLETWGRRTANKNALKLLRIHAGIEGPLPSVAEAREDARNSPLLSTLAVA